MGFVNFCGYNPIKLLTFFYDSYAKKVIQQSIKPVECDCTLCKYKFVCTSKTKVNIIYANLNVCYEIFQLL